MHGGWETGRPGGLGLVRRCEVGAVLLAGGSEREWDPGGKEEDEGADDHADESPLAREELERLRQGELEARHVPPARRGRGSSVRVGQAGRQSFPFWNT